ncbi:MAG: hypothetical protein AB9835_10280 [Eubacteriales bacterium]
MNTSSPCVKCIERLFGCKDGCRLQREWINNIKAQETIEDNSITHTEPITQNAE